MTDHCVDRIDALDVRMGVMRRLIDRVVVLTDSIPTARVSLHSE